MKTFDQPEFVEPPSFLREYETQVSFFHFLNFVYVNIFHT